jgi:MoaA/NifB/PqqE/SkfB family radical SAM enzyme
MDGMAVVSKPVIIMTGGEPLLRSDVFDLAQYGTDKGFRMVMATNGTLFTEEIVRKMKSSGIQRVSISLDGPTAETHDASEGKGSFEGSSADRAVEKGRR